MVRVALLISAQNISKSFGSDPLFRDLSLVISEQDRLGLVGPNGSGKTTLLQTLSRQAEPDLGEVAVRKNTRVSYVAQDSQFPAGETVRSVIRKAIESSKMPEDERLAREAESLGRAGFSDFDADASLLSGGWRKRLAVAEALVQDPDVLLLDEPTNHLDLAGISWLEDLLKNSRFASVVVSHDRYFLENVATVMVELDRVYPEGLLRVQGNYSKFLEKKDEFLHAQARRQEALENRVRNELEWLRRGPKARATKAKARIDQAHELAGELASIKSRSRTATTDIDFTSTDRKSKRLIEFDNVSYRYEDQPIVRHLDFTITAGSRVGLVGPNGSGKTTLLRLIEGLISPQTGEIRRAESLRVVHFEQFRQLNPDVALRRALAPDGDSVIYQDRAIHIASWASRFLFSNEQLDQPVGRLSGGERARVLIASLMLQPADLLLLDEPTNDLDIPTLEVLEESLIEFGGALILVTHDRFMLDRVSTVILGLDGQESGASFADYSQWEAWFDERVKSKPKPATSQTSSKTAVQKKKLSYIENREYESIEQRIAEAERDVAEKSSTLEDPDVLRDRVRVQQASAAIEAAQEAVDSLYERWAELEAKLNG
jgi:ATP-binding cassette subfamily F protein uup